MKLRRSAPVIGQPVDPEQERALRDELFAALWVPKMERLEAWSTPLGVVAGICLVLWMLIGIIIAAAKHAPGAVS